MNIGLREKRGEEGEEKGEGRREKRKGRRKKEENLVQVAIDNQ